MARKKPDAQPAASPPVSVPRSIGVGAAGILSLTNIFVVLVEKIGLPGALLGALLYILDTWSTKEQKQRMIEMYALGNGIQSAWPIIAMAALFVLALWAQNTYLRRRLRIEHAEVMRIGGEKTALQVAASPTDLEHTHKLGANDANRNRNVDRPDHSD
jgi:predicted lysophospholipase L1 biosynthesis ABC-type transport system permease subunit